MFRLFENAANPFGGDDPSTPPQRVLPYLIAEFRPMRFVIAAGMLTTVVSACLVVWFIGYAGRLVDTLASADRAALWQAHGAELIAVGVLILLARPFLHLLNEGLDDIAFRPDARTLALWRAHRRVSRQPVGWFRNDLAGRIATWVREGSAAAVASTYVVIHTLAFVLTYIAGSVWLMSAIDPRLALPLGIWILLYAGLMAYVVPRYRLASERHQDADSAVTGLVAAALALAFRITSMAEWLLDGVSSKSTLVNLILRFFDPESGTVEIDGQDIATVTRHSLRRQIAMVTQEATLLHRSVRENIGPATAGEAAIIGAARQAAALDFITALVDGDGRTGYHARAIHKGVRPLSQLGPCS